MRMLTASKVSDTKALLSAHAEFEPSSNPLVRNVEFLRPLLNGESLTMKRQKDILSGVVGLLFERSPSAIFRAIVPINIRIAIQGWLLFGRTPHVSEEILKRFPSFTNLDSSFAVVLRSREVRIVAPLIHRSPCIVNSGATHPMLGAGAADCCGSVATATCRAASNKAALIYSSLSPTIAATHKKLAVLCCWMRKLSDNKKHAEFCANVFAHSLIIR